MKTAYVYPFPIRTINFSNSTDKDLYEKIVKLVERMFDLKRLFAKAKIETKKTMIQRQIDAIEQQINQLVYKLYDLTDEEIEIVEQGKL